MHFGCDVSTATVTIFPCYGQSLNFDTGEMIVLDVAELFFVPLVLIMRGGLHRG